MDSLLPTHLMRFLVPVEGDIEAIDGPMTITQIEQRLGAAGLDTVNLRDRRWGRMMLVDDQGMLKRLPVNHLATAYYHSVCRPGTTHQIRGPVIVVPDNDFGSDL